MTKPQYFNLSSYVFSLDSSVSRQHFILVLKFILTMEDEFFQA